MEVIPRPWLRPPIILALAALGIGLGLLVLDFATGFTSHPLHAATSALPLILIGLAWLFVHPGFGVHPIQFIKRLIAAVAFVLWGVDQMLPPGKWAIIVGDLVIGLFVLDMALIVRGELTPDPND